jgi:hypothetical protein
VYLFVYLCIVYLKGFPVAQAKFMAPAKEVKCHILAVTCSANIHLQILHCTKNFLSFIAQNFALSKEN